jgi:hypothetical protein
MTGAVAQSAEEERLRPLYARVLRLRHVDPGGVLCFVYFEGMVSLGLLLALAELVSWWQVPLLPVCVAGMVKANDLVAAAVARSAARVPAQERDRFRRELQPAVGRARVVGPSRADPELDVRTEPVTGRAGPASGRTHAPASGRGSLPTSGAGGLPARQTRADGGRAAQPGGVPVGVARVGRRTGGTVWRTGSGRRSSGPGWTGGFAPGVWEVAGRLVARLVPAGRPLSVTAVVRAGLAAGARPRPEPDLERRPDLGFAERLRGGAPGPSPLVATRVPTGTPQPYRPSRGMPRGTGGPPPTTEPAARSDTGEPTHHRAWATTTGSGTVRPVDDRRADRHVWRASARLYPADGARRRVRPSSVQRYE